MNFRRIACLGLLLALGLVFAGSVSAQESFFKGKTIRIIVGFSAGGGYDTYARTIARHMGRHIPGNPVIVVENMAGAGSLISANHLYKAARPDGLTIGHFIGGLFIQQILGKSGIEFDARKFEYIGVPTQDHYATGISRDLGITSVQQWLAAKTPIKFGGIATGAATSDIPRLLIATLGLPIQVVDGYKGTSLIRLAFNSGEVHGLTNGWESTRTTWKNEVQSGKLVQMLQHFPTRHPELSNVPLDIEFAKNEEARQLLKVGAHSLGPTARPFVLPPGTPNDRVQILRRAFMATMKDPEFLAETQKANLDITPADGADLEANVNGIFNLQPELAARLKEILQ
jgi:tripartite-type tricarboxylate transporter receptor subunit TctC